jgi:SOS response regulatory protein OraA/RecX
MQKLDFNQWMEHITKQLQEDYRKLYYTSKFKSNDTVIQKLPRRASSHLRRV